MALAPFLTKGLGNGTFSGNITQVILTGLTAGQAAVRATDDGAAWYVVLKAARSVK